jgi:hypothetical protein
LRSDLHTQAELCLQQIIQFFCKAAGLCRGVQMLSFTTPIIADLTYDKRRRQWQFGSGKAERFARQRSTPSISYNILPG